MKPKIQASNFMEGISKAIVEGRHVEYLREVLRKYRQYQEEFEKNFSAKNPQNAIYKFRAVYLSKKSVWRDIEIRADQTFDVLADTVVVFMGWLNDHMHGFEFLHKKETGDPLFTGSSIAFFAPGWEDDPHPTYKTDEIRVCNIDYKKQPKLRFTFDFGDRHQFDVVFKGTRNLHKDEKRGQFPVLVDQRGVGPEQYPDRLADTFDYGSLKLSK